MNLEDVRVLITGGAGFIGANLAKFLVGKGAKVTVFDDFSTGYMENLEEIARDVVIVRADVRDFESVKEAIANQEYVFHMAANASVPISTENPQYDFEVNAVGTFNVLKAMLDLDLDAPLLFASSAAVYGEPKSVPIQEDHELKPLSPYGTSKLTAELYCQTFHRVYGLPTVCLRYFNVYGPLQRKYVMFDLLNKLKKQQDKLEVLGTGNQVRDFLYVSDAVEAAVLLAQTPSAFGEVYNVGTGVGTSIRKLVVLLLKTLNLQDKTEVYYTSQSWKGDVQKLVADIAKIRKHNFQPKVRLKTGLRRLINWYNNSILRK